MKRESYMSDITLVVFLLGLLGSLCFAADSDAFRPALPLLVLTIGSWLAVCLRARQWSLRWMDLIVTAACAYAAWRMANSEVRDLARSDALLLATGWSSYVWGRLANRRDWDVFIMVVGVLALVNVAIGVHQIAFPTDISVFYGKVAVKGMAIGLYGHYNHLANFLLLAGFLSLGVAISDGRKKALRVFCWLVFVACCGGLVLSQSRGGILAAIVAVFVASCLWLVTLWRKKVTWAAHATLGFVVLVPILAVAAYQMGRQVVFERGTNDGGRWSMSRAAMELIVQEPLLGHGSRAYSYKCLDPQIWKASGMRHDYADPVFVHNELLQAACDYGVVGLIAVLSVVGLCLFRALIIVAIPDEGKASARSDNGAVLGAMIAMVAMLVQSFFSFVFHTQPDVIIFAVFLGYITQQVWPLDDQVQTPRAVWPAWGLRGLHTAAAALTCFMFWRHAAVWMIVDRPLVNRIKAPQEQEKCWIQAKQWLEDYRIHRELGFSLATAMCREGSNVESRKLNEAYLEFCEVEKRHPWEYISQLNQALMLDDLGRYAESAPIFQKLLDPFMHREIVYRVRYYYMRHLTRRAAKAWENYDSGHALWLYQMARDQLEITRSYGAIGHELYGVLLHTINERMGFLVEQKIVPSEHPLAPNPASDTEVVPAP